MLLLIALTLIALVLGAAIAGVAPHFYDKNQRGMTYLLFASMVAFVVGCAVVYFWQAPWGIPLASYGLPCALIAGGLRFGGLLVRKIFVSV
jgi:Sec-independent protein secretion pathway component TatC